MQYNKILVSLFSAALLAVIVIFGIEELQWDGTVSLSAVITSDGQMEEVTCWEAADGEYILFLPSYAELSQVRFQTHTTNTVYIAGQVVTEETACDTFELNTPYDLAYDSPDGYHHFQITFMKSGKVPTVYIDVPSGSMDYIHAVKGNEEPGTISVYTAEGNLNHAGNLKSINGRGNATWELPKKAYSLTLMMETDLLSMGKAQKWILLANAYDSSHLKNKIAYDLADAVGLAYSPQCEWVDLYLNGEYAGLYLLSERNEVHSQRVDIPQEDSFLVSLELEWRLENQGYPFFSTQNGNAFRIHYTSISNDELAQIWQSAENAILAEDGVDPDTGRSWIELIDLDSWAKKYLMDEVLANIDGGIISQYFYFNRNEKSGKICAGPVWDMDSTLGSTRWQMSSPYALSASRPHIWGETDKPLFHALYQKEAFYQRVVELYRSVFQPLLENLLNEKIDQYAEQVSQAAIMNQIRWGTEDAEESTEKICAYMIERMNFLNDLWIEGEKFYTVEISDASDIWACYAVRAGDCLPALAKFENTKTDWYTIDSDEPFDITQPILEDVRIYPKQKMVNAE